MTSPTGTQRRAALAASVLLWSCAGAAPRAMPFSTDWEDDRESSIAHEWQGLLGAPVSRAADVAIGIAASGDDRVLGGRSTASPCRPPSPARCPPVVAGRMVMISAGRCDDGRRPLREPSFGARADQATCGLLGAGDDRARAHRHDVSQAGQSRERLSRRRPRRTGCSPHRDAPRSGGSRRRERNRFRPWDGQYVSAINVSSGDEEARVTLRDVASRAWIVGGALWFGETNFTRFDERIRWASRGAASVVRIPARELPGVPRLMFPGGSPVSPESNAQDRMRIYARPVGGSTFVDVADHRYYATYFRLVLGFDTPSGAVAWVHHH